MATGRVSTPAAKIRKLADAQDRQGIFKTVFEYSIFGLQRICDAQGLGPASVKDFKMTTQEWDKQHGEASQQ